MLPVTMALKNRTGVKVLALHVANSGSIPKTENNLQTSP